MVHQLQSQERVAHEQYLLEYFEQFDVSIRKRDFAFLNDDQLSILHEVCRDRKNYDLAKSNLTFDPSGWTDASTKDWITFVSKKYVDHNHVDPHRGDSDALEGELRKYWTYQKEMWKEAASLRDQLRRISHHRSHKEQIINLSKTIRLSSAHPNDWTDEDEQKFTDWFRAGQKPNSDTTLKEVVNRNIQEWTETLDFFKMDPQMDITSQSTDDEEEDEEDEERTESEDMSPPSYQMVEFTHSPPSSCQPFPDLPHFYPTQPVMTEFGDPEDWDKDLLNRWLQMEFAKFRSNFNAITIPERKRRLIMIYVRCAWPCDKEKNALKGLCRIFGDDVGYVIHEDILRMRPASRAQEVVVKPDSQRHRNRRDLHLWEFLLILIANSEYEFESIRWKDRSRGIFELTNRHRIAKMWGLTKGNIKMTYDNMSRSVRQYYKDDQKAGIMIRHQPGTASLGKYSYQFSMSNNEVQKLLKSLHP